MTHALQDMLAAYRPSTTEDYQNAVREIVQEIALLGLWRGRFFEHAAFYGGTALRVFHGLRRFSEDLDFTLLESGMTARLEHFLPAVATELETWGFRFEAAITSDGTRTAIESAFLKGNTQINLLHIGAPKELARQFPHSQQLRIKMEMDLDPPARATTEISTRLLPSPYQVRIYDLPSLFAGKLHAVLCRGWKSRVKGRDFFDFCWYISRSIRPNLSHLDARMRQSGHWQGETITSAILTGLLKERFARIDFQQAANEVKPFLTDPRELDLWSTDFFCHLAEQLGTS